MDSTTAVRLCKLSRMRRYDLPLHIQYDTHGLTPIADVIAGLQSTELIIQESVSLLPSLIDGLYIEGARINVQRISQESPLRELFLVSLFLGFQDNLEAEVPPMVEKFLGIDVPDDYDTILTVIVMMVAFYGLGFAVDVARRGVDGGGIRSVYNGLIADLASKSSRNEDELKAILRARYAKPKALRRIIQSSMRLFRPARNENVPVSFDRRVIGGDVVREIPFSEEFGGADPFRRYDHHSNVQLEVHAQDRDNVATGWAAVPQGITPKRLRMKIMPPVEAGDLWNIDKVSGDVTIVSQLTADGFVPKEMHLTRLISKK